MNEGMIELVGLSADGDQRRRPAPVALKQYCPDCGKAIHYVRTVAGKLMPCELVLDCGDGKKTLVTHSGATIRRAGEERFGYEPHWGKCGVTTSLRRIANENKGGVA